MSVNAFKPHVLILPEDDANRQVANGFWYALEPEAMRCMQVLAPPGGWLKVVAEFEEAHVSYLERFAQGHMVLIIDFDGDPGRLSGIQQRIPGSVKDRVFVVGARSEPEALRSAGLGSFETIGQKLAKDCLEDACTTWSHTLLQHNAGELQRLRERVKPILSGQR